MRDLETANKSFRFYLWMILGLAFVLRLAGIGYGLPYIYHQDEPILVNHAMALGVSGPNPHFFVIPSFSIYFLFSLYAACFAIGKIVHFFHNVNDFALLFLQDPSLFYFLGRFFLGAFFGTLTVGITAKLGKALFSPKTGIMAALLLAISPLHVEQSHYLYADVPLTLAAVCLFYRLFFVLREPSYKNYLLMGAVFGLGTGMKYTMVYFLPAVLITHILAFKKEFASLEGFSKALTAASASLLTYFAVAPYTFLDWVHFQSQIIRQSGAELPVGIFHHLVYSLIEGTSPVLFAFFLGGALFLMRRSKREAWVFIPVILFYYGINAGFSQHSARYMLPLVPLLCVLAALGWEVFESRLKKIPFFSNMAFLFLFVSLILPSAYLDLLFLKKDTRTECLEWVHKNIPEGSAIAMDNRFYGPHLVQTKEEILKKYQFLGSEEGDIARKSRLDLMVQVAEHQKTYRVYTLSQTDENGEHPFLFQRPFVKMDLEALKETGIEYLIFNYSEHNFDAYEFRRSITKELEKVMFFSPYKDPSQKIPFDPYAATAATHLRKDLLSRVSFGPYLEVYRLKK